MHLSLYGPGYHLISIKGHDFTDNSFLTIEHPDLHTHSTIIPLQGTGLIVMRLYKPGIALVRDCLASESGDIKVQVSRLSFLRRSWLKLRYQKRFKARTPLKSSRGYVCILKGMLRSSELASLRFNAQTERELGRLNLNDECIAGHKRFDSPSEWLIKPRDPTVCPGSASLSKIGVVLHLYYTQLWPEFALFLQQINQPFDLLVTHCKGQNFNEASIKQLWPGARIISVENRGRDILPFIELLNAGVLERYNCICKLHSKMSLHKGEQTETMLGARWRRRFLYDLIAGGRADLIIQMFRDDETLGLLGPEALRLPNALLDVEESWGATKTRSIALDIAKKMGQEKINLDYFAGSMFWVRPKALESLKQLNLQSVIFSDEQGQIDGELHHAIERLFSVSVAQAGYKVAAVPPLDCSKIIVAGACLKSAHVTK